MNPTNASNKKVTWSSSDPLVASVPTTITTLENEVTAHKKGTATITVTADGGQVATLLVDVKNVASFTVVDYKPYYDPNDKFQLTDTQLDITTKLKVTYDDNTVNPELIPATLDMIEPYLPRDWEKLSTPFATPPGGLPYRAASEVHTLPIKYGGVWGSFDVTIRAIRWVTIIGTPKRTVYGIGEPFDPDGLTLTVSYDVGPNVTGIPVTTEMVSTAVSVFSSRGSDIWNREYIYQSNRLENGIEFFPATSTDPAFYSKDNGSNAAVGIIGPLTYKGMITSEQGVNLTTLNGAAAIDGLTVAPLIAKVTIGANTFEYLAATTLESMFTLVRGKKATITISSLNPTINAPILVSGPSDITLIGYNDQVGLNQNTDTMFKVLDGAILKLENIILNGGAYATATRSGITAPMIWVTGKDTNFILGNSTRVMLTTRGMDYTAVNMPGIMFIESGTATIEEGATLVTVTGVPGTLGNAVGENAYISTNGIFVGPQGTLKMLGGSISGVGPAGGHPSINGLPNGGVGDVVVAGTLELGGKAVIGRLALAAMNGPLATAPVKINDDWNPLMQSIILNLTGNAQNPDPTAGATTDAVWFLFANKPLFTGKTDAATMGKFSFEPGSANGYNGGGFFANKALGTGGVANPMYIPHADAASNYALRDGVFVLRTN